MAVRTVMVISALVRVPRASVFVRPSPLPLSNFESHRIRKKDAPRGRGMRKAGWVERQW